MSADYWLDDEGVEVGNFYCTYNLGPMLRAAGFPDWRQLIAAPASETGGVLASVADELRGNPDKYQAMNPPNGWGTYEGAIGFLDSFASACADHPAAYVGGSL